MARRRSTGPKSSAGLWDYVHDLQPTIVSPTSPGGIRSLAGPNPTAAKRFRYNFEVRRWAAYNEYTYNQARTDRYFKDNYRILADIERRVARGEDVDRSPRGKYARALEALNYRRPMTPWNVGETPKVKSA